MLTVQKLLLLRRADLFADMSTRELGHVARIAREAVYSAGSTIFDEGDYGDSLFIIASGEVAVTRGGRPIGVLREADYFGEMAVLTGETRSATIKASSDCLLLRIEQPEFHQILAGNFDAVLAVIRTLCRRLRPADSQRGTDSG